MEETAFVVTYIKAGGGIKPSDRIVIANSYADAEKKIREFHDERIAIENIALMKQYILR